MGARQRSKISKKCSKGRRYSARDSQETLLWLQWRMRTALRKGARARWLWGTSCRKMPLKGGCLTRRSRHRKRCCVNMAEAIWTQSRAWFQLPEATLTSWSKRSIRRVQAIWCSRKIIKSIIIWQIRSKSRRRNWNALCRVKRASQMLQKESSNSWKYTMLPLLLAWLMLTKIPSQKDLQTSSIHELSQMIRKTSVEAIQTINSELTQVQELQRRIKI